MWTSGNKITILSDLLTDCTKQLTQKFAALLAGVLTILSAGRLSHRMAAIHKAQAQYFQD